MSVSVALGLAGAITVGAALLPARGSDSAETRRLQPPRLRSSICANPRPSRGRSTCFGPRVDRSTRGCAYVGRHGPAADRAGACDGRPDVLRTGAKRHRLTLSRSSRTSNDVALAARAAMLSARHRFTAALETARAALRIDPYSASALGVRVDALTELGRLREALRAADSSTNGSLAWQQPRGSPTRQSCAATTTWLSTTSATRCTTLWMRPPAHSSSFTLESWLVVPDASQPADQHYRSALQSCRPTHQRLPGLAKIDALRGKDQRRSALLPNWSPAFPFQNT